MFFESYHSTEHNFFTIIEEKISSGYSLHIHKAYECYTVKSGRAIVKVDDKEYQLLPGEAVLVFPYQSHEYKTDYGTSARVCIFSPDLVEGYNYDNSYIPTDNKFLYEASELTFSQGLLMQKSLCYNICARFDKEREYVKRDYTKSSLMLKLLMFISENYHRKCTLYLAAQSVGYDYNYISKIFKNTVKLSFNEYLNNLRISEACNLLNLTSLSVQAIAEKCGYSCTRTFHRAFYKIMQMTPNEYKARCKI